MRLLADGRPQPLSAAAAIPTCAPSRPSPLLPSLPLQGASDMLMAPKAMLLDPAIRDETVALPIATIAYLLSRFAPDDYAPDAAPPGVLAELRAAARDAGQDPDIPPAVEIEGGTVYYSPTDDMVMEKVPRGGDCRLEGGRLVAAIPAQDRTGEGPGCSHSRAPRSRAQRGRIFSCACSSSHTPLPARPPAHPPARPPLPPYAPLPLPQNTQVEVGEEPGLEYGEESEDELSAVSSLGADFGAPPPLRFRLLHALWAAGVPRAPLRRGGGGSG
jgi:hypothetical protein